MYTAQHWLDHFCFIDYAFHRTESKIYNNKAVNEIFNWNFMEEICSFSSRRIWRFSSIHSDWFENVCSAVHCWHQNYCFFIGKTSKAAKILINFSMLQIHFWDYKFTDITQYFIVKFNLICNIFRYLLLLRNLQQIKRTTKLKINNKALWLRS